MPDITVPQPEPPEPSEALKTQALLLEYDILALPFNIKCNHYTDYYWYKFRAVTTFGLRALNENISHLAKFNYCGTTDNEQRGIHGLFNPARVWVVR